MSESVGISLTCCGQHRRAFLKLSGMAVTGVLTGNALLSVAFADALTKVQRDSMTPGQVIDAMKRGNERFSQGKRNARSFLNEQKASAKGQFPAAIILSCIDSRAPAEIIMDAGIGDTFNARVAGNIANDDILGSMEFACQLSGAKVVLVMGHTKCGAIKGAIDNAKLGNLTALLDKIQPAVKATAYSGSRTANNYDFVDAVARKNVELTMVDIRQRSTVLRELAAAGTIKIVGAMYDIETAKIDFLSA
jgi:carbonic anhydrase